MTTRDSVSTIRALLLRLNSPEQSAIARADIDVAFRALEYLERNALGALERRLEEIEDFCAQVAAAPAVSADVAW